MARARSLRGLRWPLYVVIPEIRLYLRRGAVAVESSTGKDTEEPVELPVADLSHLVF